MEGIGYIKGEDANMIGAANVPESPLASYLAYTAGIEGQYDIWLYNPMWGISTVLTKGLADYFSRPEWSPDCTKLAFIGKGNVVYVIEVQSGATSRIDQIEPGSPISWAPDSQSIAYLKQGRIQLYQVHTHKGDTLPLSQTTVTEVQWFPSGKELLFASTDSIGNSQLYRVRADGSVMQQITKRTDGPLHNLKLSPDGRYALYTSPGASVSLLSTVQLDTGFIRTLTGGPLGKNYYPAWSPDSASIAYSATTYEATSGYTSLIQVDSRLGGNQVSLARSNCYSTPVSWSPDGRQLTYLSGCSPEGYASEIWSVNLRTHTVQKLVRSAMIVSLQWSPGLTRSPPLRLYRNPAYRVSLYYPAGWRPVTEERYEGASGFFQISAIASSGALHEVCRGEAFHPLKPYGSTPRILPSVIQAQPACVILPSQDQPPEMGRQAAVIVRYRVPIVIGDTTYHYFILWTNRESLPLLTRGLSLGI